MATPNARKLPDIPRNAKERTKRFTWAQIEADRDAALQGITKAAEYGCDDQEKLELIFKCAGDAYARIRDEKVLWKKCEGKQILNNVAISIGFSGPPALVRAALKAWDEKNCDLPNELVTFRKYIESL